MVLVINFFHLLILIFVLPTNRDFGRWKQDLFEILFFAHLKKKYLKNFSSVTNQNNFRP